MRFILSVCASCEWIFKRKDKIKSCPKCGFAYYSAKHVYGNKAYRYAKTQEPWKNKKLAAYDNKLNQEIKNENCCNDSMQNGFKKIAWKAFKKNN